MSLRPVSPAEIEAVHFEGIREGHAMIDRNELVIVVFMDFALSDKDVSLVAIKIHDSKIENSDLVNLVS